MTRHRGSIFNEGNFSRIEAELIKGGILFQALKIDPGIILKGSLFNVTQA